MILPLWPFGGTSSSVRASLPAIFRTQYVDLPVPLPLDCGRTLERRPHRLRDLRPASRPTRDNVILVCHALSGDAHAAGFSDDADAPTARATASAPTSATAPPRGGLGWWDGMIGPGKAFDTDRYFVVCTNLLGGCRGSTGPSSTNPATGRPYGSTSRSITVADMVRAERAFLDGLGIDAARCRRRRLARRHAGARVGGCAIPTACGVHRRDRQHARARQPQGVAWNAIARNAITADPDWQGGDYYGTGRAPDRGHRRRAHGRPRHVSLGGVDRPTSSAGGCRIATTTRTR